MTTTPFYLDKRWRAAHSQAAMYQCNYNNCKAQFSDLAELAKHWQRWHWDDYLGTAKLATYEQLAAEGMIGHKADN